MGRNDMMRPKLSLVLPVHGQADHIARVVRSFAVALQTLDLTYEIILVPNGSAADDRACRDLGQELQSVSCRDIEGRGWGRAVRAGIAEARGDLICFANSARTQADDLRRIVAAGLANNGAVVKALRVRRHSIVRRAGSRAFNLLCNGLLHVRTADVNGTPKAFPRTAAGLLNLVSDDDLLDLEFMWRCRRDNLRLIEIEVQSDRRHGGRSTTNLGTATRLCAGAIRFWRQTRAESFGR
jgi:glycosyltransferase involved in cell wall biosynthesis